MEGKGPRYIHIMVGTDQSVSKRVEDHTRSIDGAERVNIVVWPKGEEDSVIRTAGVELCQFRTHNILATLCFFQRKLKSLPSVILELVELD